MHVAASELARQLEQIAADYLVSRYSGPGNPMGTEILRGEGFVATKVPFAPSNMIMNRAHGGCTMLRFVMGVAAINYSISNRSNAISSVSISTPGFTAWSGAN